MERERTELLPTCAVKWVTLHTHSSASRTTGTSSRDCCSCSSPPFSYFNLFSLLQHGYTPLHRASAQGHLKVVEFLVKNGCPVDKEDEVRCPSDWTRLNVWLLNVV